MKTVPFVKLDLHNHSMFSPDSDARPEEMIEAAVRSGAGYFGFTEHIDYEYAPHPYEVVHDIPETEVDVSAAFSYLVPLKHKYAAKIRVLTGLEFGYNPLSDMSRFSDLERTYPLDYVINSVHVAGGIEGFWKENLVRFSKEQAYETYLKAVLASLDAPYRYEIVGHIGYISRNAPYADPYLAYADYADLLDEILRGIVARDVTLEINTSSRTAGSAYLPNDGILARYRELGGENITFASDAHGPDRVLDRFDLVVSRARQLGYRYLDVYEGRERIKVKLEE